MNENEKKESGKELGIQQLLAIILRKGWIIMLVGILCAGITFAGTYYLITPKYQSSTMFYVNNSNLNLDSLTSGDLVAAQELVESYIVILESRETLLEIKDYAGVDRSVSELQGMITAASVNSTEIFRVVVTSPDPQEAHDIANAIAEILPKRISTIIDGTSAKVVDHPIVANSPSSPSYVVNTLVGFALGFLCASAVFVLREVFDLIIRTEEDVQRSCDHPVLAAVPDMNAPSKGGYYERDKKRRSNPLADKETVLVGSGISFAASEAYKLLRTKLQFSFVDENDCHIIGISSAMAGEGKSLSSVNLAYSLAQLEKRVLLIDCDMRRPSLNTKLPIQKTPGLSNYLTRQVQLDKLMQNYTSGQTNFDVIAAGRNPPNPIELLSSQRMQELLSQLRGTYDYIILDLPPVGEVSDALVAAKLVDGILLVVRQNYCDRRALSEATSQFSFVDGRVLGVVFNCTVESSFRYKSYRYYKRYYHRYEGSYSRAARAAQQKEQE
ncbi:MAG: polysaccharide biosynthesis tyrosine autokinase [Ruminococcaceae bacterium]|nr:polysaccharide biosynthesis tyrosine autokinase [Oscillospiraceae bacterium]